MKHPFPLFIIAIAFLTGIALSKIWILSLILPLFLYAARCSYPLSAIAFCVFAAGAFWNYHHINSIPRKESCLKGVAEIERIKKISSPFGVSLRVEAKLHGQNIPLCWVIDEKALLPQNDLIWIEASAGYHDGRYLHLTRVSPMANIPHTSQYHARRMVWKNHAENKLEPIRRWNLAHGLLTAMVSGCCTHRYLLFLLNKSGLQHMIAISGYHLQLLTTLITTLFILSFRNIKPAIYGALCVVTLYLFFLGLSPPVCRAFIMLFIAAIGRLFGYPIHPLNGLGAALFFELAKDPLALMDMGAQLSYSATAAIILCYPGGDLLLKKMLGHHHPIPSYAPFVKKILRFFAIGIRKILSLNITIHLWTFPLLLYHLKSLSLLTFLYTLYMVPLIGLSLILLLFFFLIPLKPLLTINAIFTQSYLSLLENFPRSLDATIHLDPINPLWISIALFLALCYTICGLVYKRLPKAV